MYVCPIYIHDYDKNEGTFQSQLSPHGDEIAFEAHSEPGGGSLNPLTWRRPSHVSLSTLEGLSFRNGQAGSAWARNSYGDSLIARAALSREGNSPHTTGDWGEQKGFFSVFVLNPVKKNFFSFRETV